MYDLIIRGAEICDGSGSPRRGGDIAIADGRIAAVGAVTGAARRTLDANGLVAAPGFIDVHTHYDCQVSWDPALTPSSWHGVTSVVMGNCGFSIAPCRPTHRDLLMEMLLYVEGMTEPCGPAFAGSVESFPGVPRRGRTVAAGDQRRRLRRPLAVRYYVMGDAASERAASDEELARMQAVVRDALGAGAIGLSTSESPTHFFGSGVPVLSRVAARRAAGAGPRPRRIRSRPGRDRTAAPARWNDKLADQAFYADAAACAAGRPVTRAPLLANPRPERGDPRHRGGRRGAARRRRRRTAGRLPAARGAHLVREPRALPSPTIPSGNPSSTCRAASGRRASPAPPFATTCGRCRAAAASSPRWRRAGGTSSCASPAGLAQAAHVDRSIADLVTASGGDPVDTLLDLALAADLDCQFGIPIMNTDDTVVGQLCAIRPGSSPCPTLARTSTPSPTRASRRRCWRAGCAHSASCRWRTRSGASPPSRRRCTACATAGSCARAWRPT
ncbi:MAG: amidohydrolase family protein [Candidatus Binatia bacterium]